MAAAVNAQTNLEPNPKPLPTHKKTHLGLAELARQVELRLTKAAVAGVRKVHGLCHAQVLDVVVMLQHDESNNGFQQR